MYAVVNRLFFENRIIRLSNFVHTLNFHSRVSLRIQIQEVERQRSLTII